jgi:hypothetical protein
MFPQADTTQKQENKKKKKAFNITPTQNVKLNKIGSTLIFSNSSKSHPPKRKETPFMHNGLLKSVSLSASL